MNQTGPDHMGTASVGLRPSNLSMDMDPEEAKKVGKIHASDAPLDQVIASEMKRIQNAFDRRVVDHTEELVQKVQKGEPLVQNSQ